MTILQFVLGAVRTSAILVPTLVCARRLRVGWLRIEGPVGLLAESVVALSVLLVAAEALGLFGLDHAGALIALLVVVALLTRRLVPPGTRSVAAPGSWRLLPPYALVSLIVVVAQWCVQTANALGGGMLNFDTLWYHMPFAARFAQTGSVTAIQFTQADAFVAYYPANSELLHAIGIAALGSDFFSPLLNLMWLALALLASWCVGRRWQLEPLTLTAGCLVMSLPVLGGTQPGEAFNDIAGLAALLSAVALLLEADDTRAARILAVAGLALGLAVGTKLTFVVPVLVLVVGMAVAVRRPGRVRVLTTLGGCIAVTGGWWYLRNLLAVGNPVGLRIHIGPFALPGPVSTLANDYQQTVFSQLRHLSLWGSRFVPGLDHALGPLWPLILALYLGAAIGALWLVADGTVRAVAAAAVLTGISYLFLPTGASGIEQGTTLFEVNLRYATPALGLGLLLIPLLGRRLAPRMLDRLGITLGLIIVATQFERALWPVQSARHGLFLAAVALAGALLWHARMLLRRPATTLAALAAGGALIGGAAAYAAQRHYFERRYLTRSNSDRGLGAIYRWAQGVAHARIGLYGTVEQYPLYGARDTNTVDYLGIHSGDGNYRPITSCRVWRSALNRGRYRYVVLTLGPTAPVAISWTRDAAAAALILNPAPGDYVFRVTGRFDPAGCPPRTTP